MKVFSLKKFKQVEKNWRGSMGWATDCDGQPVEGGWCKGKSGENWAMEDEWCEEVPEDKVIFSGNATVLIKDGKKYVSKCKDGDTYDKEKGLLLCLAQANGISYRDLQEMIAGAKDCNEEKAKEFAGKIATGLVEAVKAFKKAFNGEKADDKAQVREVKRPAEEGEHIKIVKAKNDNDGEYYKNGDILKVKEPVKAFKGDVRAYYDGVGNTGGEGYNYIEDGEYVVLENYKPYKITLSEFWANEGKKVMAIHCKTEDEAKELLKAFDKAGECWRDGSSYTSYTYYSCYGEKTIYDNTHGFSNIGGRFHTDDCEKTYEFDEVDLEN